MEKWPLFKQGVLKAPLYYILFTKRALGKFKFRSWLIRLVEGHTRKRNQCLPLHSILHVNQFMPNATHRILVRQWPDWPDLLRRPCFNRIYNWRASVASETLTGVTQSKIGDVCLFIYMFGRMYVILYFDPPYFCVRSAFDPVPNFTKQNPLV